MLKNHLNGLLKNLDQLDKRYRWYSIVLEDLKRKPIQFIFRGVTLAELRISGTKFSAVESENFILHRCVTECDLSKITVGVGETLLGLIYKFSGLSDDALTVKEAEWQLKDPEFALDALAVAMIPGVTFDLIENCDPFHRAKYMMLGKIMFEALYPGQSASQAFNFGGEEGQAQSNAAPEEFDVSKMPLPQVPGIRQDRQVEGSFVWKKNKPNENTPIP